MAMLVEWDKTGWSSTRTDGFRLSFWLSVFVLSHPDMLGQGVLVIIVGPLSIALPWFRKTRREK